MNRFEKTRAFLTEFIIVILFFSIAAVITLQLFVKSGDISKSTNASLEVCIIAQNELEKVYALPDEVLLEGKNYSTSYENYIVQVNLDSEAKAAGTMVNILVKVYDEEQLYSLSSKKYISGGKNYE